MHLVRHGRIQFGDEIEISQGVEIGRPSKLFARVFGEGDRIERVEVGGSAVVVARGEFQV
jgi:trans-2,3-dihydro-3-hydroxyanthranilate isomerase